MNYAIRFIDNSELYINSKELQDKVIDVFKLSSDSVIRYSSGYVANVKWENNSVNINIAYGYILNNYLLPPGKELMLANFCNYGTKIPLTAKVFDTMIEALNYSNTVAQYYII